MPQSLQRKDVARLCLVEQRGEPLRRILPVERDVDTGRLQRPEQRDDHLGRTVEEEATRSSGRKPLDSKWLASTSVRMPSSP